MADPSNRPEADRPDGVKPCPAHGHRSFCRVEVTQVPYESQSDWPGESGTFYDWQVGADCGTSGPVCGTEPEAVQAWNAMPRRELDGTADA